MIHYVNMHSQRPLALREAQEALSNIEREGAAGESFRFSLGGELQQLIKEKAAKELIKELQRSTKDMYLDIRIASPHCVLPGAEPFIPQGAHGKRDPDSPLSQQREASWDNGSSGEYRPSYKREPRFEFRPGETLVRSVRPGKFRLWQGAISLELFGLPGEEPGSTRSSRARNSVSQSLSVAERLQPTSGRSVSVSPTSAPWLASLIECRGVTVRGGECDGEEMLVVQALLTRALDPNPDPTEGRY